MVDWALKTHALSLSVCLSLCLTDVDVDMTKLDEKLLQLLAWQRLQQLLPPSSSPMAPSTSPASAGKKGLLNGLLTPGQCADAFLW